MAERPEDKPLMWLVDKVKSPPLSFEARLEAGFLLRRLQQGDAVHMPHSRPMPSIGRRCHEPACAGSARYLEDSLQGGR